MIYVQTALGEKTAPLFADAFAAGCGGLVTDHYSGGPWIGFGSPSTWHDLIEARRRGYDFYFGDHAYFGRHQYYRVTKNAWQHRGIGVPDLKRLAPFYKSVMRWKKNGSKIIVCAQSDAYNARMGWEGDSWLESVVSRLEAHSDREIIVRTKRTAKPLAADLKDAWCVVTHASNAAVEAILAGVPAICTGDCAASIMSLRDPCNVEYPLYPGGRLEWAGVLAANQWTLEEIRKGMCWEAIR